MAKAAGKAKSKGGRKPLWEVLDMPSKLDSVRGWAMQGSTDEDIYTMLDIKKDTFYKWKKEFPEFSEALKKGKHVSNGEVLNSAFKQAVGFTYVEQVAVKLKSWAWFTTGEGTTAKSELKQIELLEVVPTERYVPPNATMSIFMLKNRLPDEYREKQEIDATLTVKKLEDLM